MATVAQPLLGLLSIALLAVPAAAGDGNEYQWFALPASGWGVGSSVAGVGDLDGDGAGDFLVGVPLYYNIFTGCGSAIGKAYLFSGATGALLKEIEDGGCGDHFGAAVASLPDTTGDGVPEFAIGATEPGDYMTPADRGYVGVYSGSSRQVLFQVRPPYGHVGQFGAAIVSIGDVNGDGSGDFAVGEPELGNVYVFSGRNPQRLYVVTGPTSFGTALASFDDLDGDSVADFVVGAPDGYGAVTIVSGADGHLLSQRGGVDDNARFGQSIAAIPDLDGDGVREIVVGAPWGPPSGYAVITSGATGDWKAVLPGDGATHQFGWSCANVGDLDGDRQADFVIGSPSPGGGGRATAFSGATLAAIFHHDEPMSAGFGWSVAGAGSVAGNAQLDFVVGAKDDWFVPGYIAVVGLSWHERWVDLGLALAGTHGEPQLSGSGDLQSGQSFTLSLTHALENTVAVLVGGRRNMSLPFMGGVLVPSLDFLLSIKVDATGSFVLAAPWPPGVPPATTAHFQYWIVDAGGPLGYAASNAIVGTTP